MGIKWRDFQLPKRLECDESTYTDTYGKFIAAPFERGYGVTLGNSLRRTLLSSIEGSAVTSVKISGAAHEFSTLPGVAEDVPEIILNLKSLVLNSHSKIPKTIYIKKDSKGEVKAKISMWMRPLRSSTRICTSQRLPKRQSSMWRWRFPEGAATCRRN